MRTIDTCNNLPYSPLIPAVKAIFTSPPGEKIEIIMNKPEVFSDLKEYLSEQNIGFREIYEEERMILQFTIPIR